MAYGNGIAFWSGARSTDAPIDLVLGLSLIGLHWCTSQYWAFGMRDSRIGDQ